MLLTGTSINPSQYDHIVIGSGPAGMTVAVTLARANKRVLMIESGEGAKPRSDLPQAINYGHFSNGWWGRHSIRALGGTSAVWAGWLATMMARDFTTPVNGSRWPITREDLAPYYPPAAVVLDRDPKFLDVEQPLFPGFIYRPYSVREDAPTQFGVKYKSEVESSTTLDVLLGCSITGIDANDGRSVIRQLTGFHHPTKTTITLPIAPAQSVVVAGGGIGTPWLLLQPRRDGAVQVGNESGLVGRFLMEHPHFVEAGECVLSTDLDALAKTLPVDHPVHALVPDAALMQEAGLRTCSIACQHQSSDNLIAAYMSRTGTPHYHYLCTVRTDMLPSEQNRVFITNERDAAGLYRPAVRCVIDGDDFRNGENVLQWLGKRLIEQDRGRVRIINSRIYGEFTGGGHLMGTTRMGTSASASVVDRDCRVHGYRNFYIAGSSVFVTSAYANPTLTIVALALRLVDTLKQAA